MDEMKPTPDDQPDPPDLTFVSLFKAEPPDLRTLGKANRGGWTLIRHPEKAERRLILGDKDGRRW